MKEKLKLFSSLTHELRTPLNCAIACLQMLSYQIDENIYDEFV